MMELEFKTFLENGNSLTKNGINYRMTKARKAEDILRMSLDFVVEDDEAMYNSLSTLGMKEDPKHNPMQNAVRKYYLFKNGREFPQLRHYKQ